MVLPLLPDVPPLRIDDDGTVRVADTRITLDVIVEDFEAGNSAEMIAQELESLQLADVYAVLAFYLKHRQEVTEYLREREQQATEVLGKVEAAGATWPEESRCVRAALNVLNCLKPLPHRIND
jgi:uncharacterized protein (DUF433 family)